MEYEALEEREEKGSWRVQVFDHGGLSLIARFKGQAAQQAATEYAAWKSESEHITTLNAVLFSLQMQ